MSGGKEYTKEEIDDIKLGISIGLTFREIGEILERNERSVANKAKSLGIISKNHLVTLEKYIKRIPNDITVIGEYINTSTKVDHLHSCGHIWAVKPNDVLMGHGCPRCNKGYLPYTQGETYLYLVYFKTIDLYKIGITIFKDLKRRFTYKGFPEYEIILMQKFSNGKEAFEREQQLLFNIKELLYNSGKLPDGNTETFRY